MKPTIAPWLILISLSTQLNLTGCNASPTPDLHKETFIALGTLVEVTFYTDDPTQVEPIKDAVRQDLKYIDSVLHAWRPGSLGRTNQLLSVGGEFSANPAVLPLLGQAQQLSQQSQGLFNPAIGHLIKLWGYQQDDPPQGPPPSAQQIAEILAAQPRMSDFVIKGIRINNRNPSVRIDLGAIAKGYASEIIATNLRHHGITQGLVAAAGDIKAIGQPADRPWRIGIRHPRQSGVIASTELYADEAISTSGDYERFYEYQGKRYHHILDPRNGYPADQSISVSVIHHNAVTADAAATALFIAGPKQLARIATAMQIRDVMLIDRHGEIYLTATMQQRLQFESEPPPVIHLINLP